jgi:site-specific recombinase XerC
LIRLSVWAGGSPILYLTDEQLIAWHSARAKAVGSATVCSEISHGRQFYRWAQSERYRVDDPTARLIIPRVVLGLPRPIADRNLMFAIMAATDREVRAILALAAFAGLRSHEIAQLDWVSIDLAADEPQIRVEEGKGGKVAGCRCRKG